MANRKRLDDAEKGLLRYLFEFGSTSEYLLDEYHFRSSAVRVLVTHELIEFNPKPRTYKLTKLGRERAESTWPWITKTKNPKSGTPHALMRTLRGWIKEDLSKKLIRGSALYGCGDHGCAFKLKKEEVLKVTSEATEVECAIGIRAQQQLEEIPLQDYPLPIVYQAGFVDIRSPLIPTYQGCLIVTGYYIREKLSDISLEDMIGGERATHIRTFRDSRGRKPHGSWELWKENEVEVRGILETLAQKVETATGFRLFDYYLEENWGKRELPDRSHEIVYRDLACIV